MNRAMAWVGLVVIGVSGGFTPARAGQVEDLQKAVQAQGQVIQQLRSELERVRKDQKQSKAQVRALEDKLETGGGGGGVTPSYVDKRIQQFNTFPEDRLYISGYGTAQYKDFNESPSTFGFSFNPIFHFMLTDRLHFDSELEISLEDNETNVELEIGQIDYLLTDWLTVSAGKFLLPFNVFGPKLHPTWSNKLPNPPPLYKHGDNPGGFIPVMSDIGAMLSGGVPLFGSESKINYALYVANGIATPDLALASNALDYRFENWPDENSNKGVGGRVGFLPIPNLEIGASFLTSKTQNAGRATLFGFDGWYRLGGLELRGEYAQLKRTGQGPNASVYGYYAQAAYRLRQLVDEYPSLPSFLGRFEPVVRWGQVDDFQPLNRKQLAVGLDYWLFESVPIKFAYEFNSGQPNSDGFFVQLAYGF